jgi:hypothetical protein
MSEIITYTPRAHPTVPMEGRGGWILDFPWVTVETNNGSRGCKGVAGQCRCGMVSCLAPGLGWSVSMRPTQPHKVREASTEARIEWDGGWRAWTGENWGAALQLLHDAVLDLLSPRPIVYLLPLTWHDEGTYDFRLVSPTHNRIGGSKRRPRSGNTIADIFDAFARGLEAIKSPTRVAVCVGANTMEGLKNAWMLGGRWSLVPEERRLRVRSAARLHAVSLRTGVPNEVWTLAAEKDEAPDSLSCQEP